VKMFDAGKTRLIGLPYGEKNYDNMLSRFHLIPERHERTDGRTDGRTDRIAINIARQCADARKTTALGMIDLADELHRTSIISRRCQRLNRLQSFCIAVLL